MTPIYTLHLDTGQDDTFSTDLSAQVLTMHWRRGHAQPHDSMAVPLAAVFTLDAVGLAAHDWIGLRLRVHVSSLLAPLLIARIVAITHTAGRTRPVLTLTATDALAELRGAQVRLPPATQQTSGALITAVLQQVRLQPTILTGRWRLGQSSWSELGDTTRFVPPSAAVIAPGRTRLRRVPDSDADTIIAALAQAEGGVFSTDRAGGLRFLGRAELLARATPVLTLTDAPDAVLYASADDLTNQLTVTFSDQQPGTPNSIVWRSPQAVLCPPYGVQRVALRWHDEQGLPVLAADIQTPLRGHDLHFGLTATTSSAALDQQVSAVLTEQSASGATLEIRNPLPQSIWLLSGAIIRSTPIRVLPQAALTLTDHDSSARYGLHARTITLPLLDNLSEVSARARYWLGQRSQPRVSLQRVTLNATRDPTVLAPSLWDRVHLTLTLPVLSMEGFITAETHEISHAGTRHLVSWELLDAAPLRYWLLGTCQLSQDTRLAY